MDECEQLNEDLRQGRRDSIDINVNDITNDVHSCLNDDSPIDFVDCSPSSFKSQAADEPSISEDEPNTYVVYINLFSL